MKNEKCFMELILNEWSLSDILCSELIHHFLESFYSSDHVTLGGFNTREGVFFGCGGRDFFQKQINSFN